MEFSLALRSLMQWRSALVWTLAGLCLAMGAAGYVWVGFYNRRHNPTLFQNQAIDLRNPRVIPRVSMVQLLIYGDDPHGWLEKAMMLFLVPGFIFALLGGIQILGGVIGGTIIVPNQPPNP